MIKVSVISPIYNVEKYLPRFFDSLKKQTLDNIEYILVNDGSSDNSLNLCNEFAFEDSRVTVINQSNQGSGAARNAGLERAKGEYVYFCDPDDYIDKDLLKENYLKAKKFNANLVIFGYFSESVYEKRLGEIIPQSKFYKTNQDFQSDFIKLYNQNLLYFVWNKLYLRKSILNLRFEKVRAGQDTRFNLNYFKNINRIYVNGHAYYHYIVARPNSAQSQIKIDKALLSIEEINKLKNLYYNVWGKNTNIEFDNLLKREYLGTAFFTLKVGKNIKKTDIRNIALDQVFNSNEISKYLNISILHNSVKDNMKIFFIKMRKNKFWWYLYKKL